MVEFKKLLIQADMVNKNGRLYPKNIIEESIQSDLIKERIKTSSFYGEAGHPIDTSPEIYASINLGRVSHMVKDLVWEDNELYGTIVTAETAIGKDMEILYNQGSDLEFALRAQGNVKNVDGVAVVESPLQIISFDLVIESSNVNNRLK
jgi:hypothetical protein